MSHLRGSAEMMMQTKRAHSAKWGLYVLSNHQAFPFGKPKMFSGS
jgi:hypothetical protein